MTMPPEDARRWPGSPAALADTTLCPACFEPLTALTCARCGLVVSDPRAVALLDIAHRMLTLETERQSVIDAIRGAHAPAAAAAAEAAAVEALAEPVAVAEPVALAESESALAAATASEAQAAAEAAWLDVDAPLDRRPEPPAPGAAVAGVPTVVPAKPVTPSAPRRRLTVPVLLLIVGVSLVGVAAIFFLTLAWFVAGIAVRALIIGTITLATIVIASLLRRRALTATAEGVAVLGVLLVALDAWAVRANDLFGAASVPPALYAGLAALAVVVVCRAWAVLSRLRGPDLAATIALPVGVGLIVGGALALPVAEAVTAGLLGVAVGGMAHALPAPVSGARARVDSVPERLTLAVVGIGGLIAAGVVGAFASPDELAVPLWSVPAIIVLGIVHAWLLRPRVGEEPLPNARPLAAVAASVAAASAALFGWQLAQRSDLPLYAQLVAPVLAVAVAVALDRMRPARTVLRPPAMTAAAIAGVSILAAFATSLVRAGEALVFGWTPWQLEPLTPLPTATGDAWPAAVAGVVMAALLFLAPTLGRPVLRDARAIAATTLVLAGAATVAVPAVLVAVAVALVIVGLRALAIGVTTRGWGIATVLATLTAYVAGTAAPWLWAAGLLVSLAVPIAVLRITRPRGESRIVLSLAPAVIAALSAFVAPEAIAVALDLAAPGVNDPLILLQWVALGALTAAVVPRLDASSRSALAFAAYAMIAVALLQFVTRALSLVGVGMPADQGGQTVLAALGEPVMAIPRTLALLALLCIIASGRSRLFEVAALGGAVLVPIVAASVVFAVADAAGQAGADWLGLALVGAAVAVIWAGALLALPAITRVPREDADPTTSVPPGYARRARIAAEIGAAATIAATAWAVPGDLAWAVWVLIALAFAGAAVTRGWADAASVEPGVPSTRARGSALADAPRRVLAWPALGAGTAALWSALATADVPTWSVEPYAIPPAVALFVFGGALVWLRRTAEATVAVMLATVIGLSAPALIDLSAHPPRIIVIALVAGALCIAAAWTPIRRSRGPALSLATGSLVALAVATVGQVLANDDPVRAWLLVFVAGAFVSAAGLVRGRTAKTPEGVYAVAAPPLAIGAASLSLALIPIAGSEPAVITALVLLGALHLTAAAVGRVPWGAATRWTTVPAALVLSTLLTAYSASLVEGVSIPIALVLLSGAALAMRRRARHGLGWPGSELGVWVAGIAIAVVPSMIAPVDPVRTWIVIIGCVLAALAAVLVRLPGAANLKTLSAVLLTAAALGMGLRSLLGSTTVGSELGALVAAVAAAAVAAAMVATAEHERRLPPVLLAAGGAVALATVILRGDGDVVRTLLTVGIAGVVAVGAAALLRSTRWQPFAAVLAVGALLVLVAAIALRLGAIPDGGTFEADAWVLGGVAIAGATGALALQVPSTRVAASVGIVWSVSLVLFAAAEASLMADDTVYGEQLAWRTALTVSALVAAGVAGVIRRERLGAALPITALVAVVLFGVVALYIGARPFEVVTAPPAVGLLALGVRRMRRDPEARSWPALGPGLALLTAPSLLYDLGESDLWRIVALGVVAIALVVVGAMRRLQAPLVLGSAVLLVHAGAQLWPWISAAYIAVPWWLWLGIGGALLIFLAARYERQMRALRTAFTTVTSLR